MSTNSSLLLTVNSFLFAAYKDKQIRFCLRVYFLNKRNIFHHYFNQQLCVYVFRLVIIICICLYCYVLYDTLFFLNVILNSFYKLYIFRIKFFTIIGCQKHCTRCGQYSKVMICMSSTKQSNTMISRYQGERHTRFRVRTIYEILY